MEDGLPMMWKAGAAAISAALVLSACAVPTTGIVDLGNGYNTVAHQGNSAWVTTASLKTAALTEAKQHCAGMGKEIQVINVKEIPSGVLGRWPEAEATFACR